MNTGSEFRLRRVFTVAAVLCILYFGLRALTSRPVEVHPVVGSYVSYLCDLQTDPGEVLHLDGLEVRCPATAADTLQVYERSTLRSLFSSS